MCRHSPTRRVAYSLLRGWVKHSLATDPLQHSKLPAFFNLTAAIVTLAGAILGTVSVCGVVPHTWGVLGWVVSFISFIRVLATRRSAEPDVQPPSLIWRVTFAGIAAFCCLFVTAMATAGAANPQAIGQLERMIMAGLIALGLASTALALRLAWK